MPEEIGSVNYATSYASSLVNLWPGNLYFEALYAAPNNGRFRWNGAKSVALPNITTTGRVNADRDTIDTAARNYDNAWETKELTHHRKWSTLIHPLDIDQTNYAVNISNITESYNIEKKFPEMDAYLISKLYADRIAVEDDDIETAALTVSNVLTVFDRMMNRMNESRVPYNGRLLYVTPAVMTLLKNAEALTHTVSVAQDSGSVTRTVNTLDGVKIIMVPCDLMKTLYTFTEGWEVAANAEQISMFLCHPGAIVAPISYQFAQLDPPGAFTEGKYIYFEESCEDVFIINDKYSALQFAVCDVTIA